MWPCQIHFWVCLFGVVSALLAAPRCEGAEEEIDRAKLVCTNRSYEFGDIASTQTVSRVFTLGSSGTVSLKIGHIQACCGTTVRLDSTNIPPGKSASLAVTFVPGSYTGRVRKTIYLHTNDPEAIIVAFRLSGNVIRATGAAPLAVPPKAP